VELNSENDVADVDIDNISDQELWDAVGFHRPLAGFWYSLTFYILTALFVAIFSGLLLSYFYPFPESMGYRTAATAIFVVFFGLFDLGTANIMDRFIGEANIKNPKKMVKYIQFFIWYQMITGLIQTTAVSIYALYFVPETELGYAVWIMLIHSTTQYPGFLGVFRNTLNSLQQFDKVSILNFISGEVFQRITEIGFVLWGRWWGLNNPEIGELMGIAIGSIIGLYLDDFLATAFSAYFFQKLMGKYDITIKSCFRIDFDKDLLKECLSFGIKTGFPLLLWPIVQLISLTLWLEYVPQYTTFISFAFIANAIGAVTGMSMNLGGAIPEAYLNDKKALTQYYIGQTWRFTALLQLFLFSMVMILILILEPLFLALNLEAYILSISFILPKLIRDFQQPYNNYSESLLIGTNNPNIAFWAHIWEDVAALVSWILIIVVWKLPQTYGIMMIAWLIPCGELFAIVTKVVFVYIFLHKKVIKIKIPIWQTFGATSLSALILYALGYMYYRFIFDPISNSIGIIASIILFVIICIFGGLIVVYIPLTVVFGAWDKGSIDSFEKMTQISGPSKFLVVPIYKILVRTTKWSKLHDRYGMDDTEAKKEARDLMRIKKMQKS
jgi:hypothetical protein